MSEQTPKNRKAEEHFDQTQWSMVLAAADRLSPDAKDALAQLCRIYWPPIYAFIRRHGHSAHEAQDLTQDFFLHLLEKDGLRNVAPELGRFRSFLMASATNFLTNQWHREQAERRGGQFKLVSFEEFAAKEAQQLIGQSTPETTFDRLWALTILERAGDRLKREYAGAGKGALYEQLYRHLTIEPPSGATADAAKLLQMSEGALRVALHRLRRRFGELLRQEIAQTVSSPTEVEEELRALFAATG